MKRLPKWYRLYLSNRLKKLERALYFTDIAKTYFDNGQEYFASLFLDRALRILKERG